MSEQAGPRFKKTLPARGLAVGDYDNDGALDVIIGVNGGAPVLLKNNAAKGNNWLGIEAGRCHLQSRCDRRANCLESRRKKSATEEQRRQLSLLARSARSLGHRDGRENR